MTFPTDGTSHASSPGPSYTDSVAGMRMTGVFSPPLWKRSRR
jgi:hypothetical protein